MNTPNAATLLCLADLVLYRSVERNDAEQERLVGLLLLKYASHSDDPEVITAFAGTLPEFDRLLGQLDLSALTRAVARARAGDDPWAESTLHKETATTEPGCKSCGAEILLCCSG